MKLPLARTLGSIGWREQHTAENYPFKPVVLAPSSRSHWKIQKKPRIGSSSKHIQLNYHGDEDLVVFSPRLYKTPV
jgi:hypothetical protein